MRIKSGQIAVCVYPQAYCVSCDERTPHRHERLAVAGAQVARAVCLACNNTRPKAEPGEQLPSRT